MKRTRWYPSNTKPARNGVYEIRFPDRRVFYSLFKGRRWHGAWWSVERAVMFGYRVQDYAQVEWRGLVEKPRGKFAAGGGK